MHDSLHDTPAFLSISCPEAVQRDCQMHAQGLEDSIRCSFLWHTFILLIIQHLIQGLPRLHGIEESLLGPLFL